MAKAQWSRNLSGPLSGIVREKRARAQHKSDGRCGREGQIGKGLVDGDSAFCFGGEAGECRVLRAEGGARDHIVSERRIAHSFPQPRYWRHSEGAGCAPEEPMHLFQVRAFRSPSYFVRRGNAEVLRTKGGARNDDGVVRGSFPDPIFSSLGRVRRNARGDVDEVRAVAGQGYGTSEHHPPQRKSGWVGHPARGEQHADYFSEASNKLLRFGSVVVPPFRNRNLSPSSAHAKPSPSCSSDS